MSDEELIYVNGDGFYRHGKRAIPFAVKLNVSSKGTFVSGEGLEESEHPKFSIDSLSIKSSNLLFRKFYGGDFDEVCYNFERISSTNQFFGKWEINPLDPWGIGFDVKMSNIAYIKFDRDLVSLLKE